MEVSMTHFIFDEFFDIFEAFNHQVASLKTEKTFTNYPYNILLNDDQSISFEIAAIGLKKEDFSIEVDGNLLNVSSERKQNNEKKVGYRSLINKLVKKDFDLTWKLDSRLDTKKLKAKLEDGLLRIDIPAKEESKKIKIEIE